MYITINKSPNLINNKNFHINLQYITHFCYIILNYIEAKPKLIEHSFNFILFFRKNNTKLNNEIFYNIIKILKNEKEKIPYKLINIFKKLENYFFSLILFSEKNQIYIQKKINFSQNFINDFYLNSFEIIDLIGNKMQFTLNIKEKIFKTFIQYVNYNNFILVKNKFIDQIILIIFAYHINIMFNNNSKIKDVEEKIKKIKKEYDKIYLIYQIEKNKSLIPDIFQIVLFNKENCIDLKYFYEIKDSIEKNDDIKKFNSTLNYQSLIFKSTDNFNIILDSKNDENIKNDFLNKKKIRSITPSLNEKTIIKSPFNNNRTYSNKKINENVNKTISAFKNLKFDFE
jgi:hypothetical protein